MISIKVRLGGKTQEKFLSVCRFRTILISDNVLKWSNCHTMPVLLLYKPQCICSEYIIYECRCPLPHSNKHFVEEWMNNESTMEFISKTGINKSKSPSSGGDKSIAWVAPGSKLNPWKPQDSSRAVQKETLRGSALHFTGEDDWNTKKSKRKSRDFPTGPVVKTPGFQGRGCRFDS